MIVVESDNSDEEPIANLRDHTDEIAALRAEIAAEKRCEVKALKAELEALESRYKQRAVSPKLSSSDDESGDKSSEKGQDPKGKKRRPSQGKGRRGERRRQKLPEHHLNLPTK